MREYLLCALLSVLLHAAVIRGTVVENQSGRPLARASVTLDPVPGTAFSRRTIRSNRYGVFEFSPIPAGSYLLSASRTGFATARFGQKQWQSSGVPIVVAEDELRTVAMRLPRFGAITGTVLDENDVGLPDFDVVAYRNTRPPQLVTRVKTDDRGVFRLFGLEPGSYLVRSVWKQYEEGGYLPTFARETEIVDQAYSYDVNFDQQVDGADVRPTPGRLYTLNVQVITSPPVPIEPLPVTITLASDMGTETVEAASHTFGPLPPGQYEIFAQAPLERRPGIQGNYQKVLLGGDLPVRMVLYQVPELQFTFEGGADPNSIRVLARRKDLAGTDAPRELKLTNNRVQLAAGPWELAVSPRPSFYAAAFAGPRYERPSDARADGWNAIFVGMGAPAVRFTLSTSPGAVAGTVRSGSDPVSGAPVFLEPFDLDPTRRVTDPFVTVTDLHGQYRFTGLAPGVYRVLSSFEYQKPDSTVMTAAGAVTVKVEQAHDSQQDLDLYGNH